MLLAQGAPDQELHGEIIDALGVLAVVGLLRAHPPLREDIPDGAGDGFVALPRPQLPRDRRRCRT